MFSTVKYPCFMSSIKLSGKFKIKQKVSKRIKNISYRTSLHHLPHVIFSDIFQEKVVESVPIALN